ncbi:MAG: hypothetical protein H5U24_16605 [Thioclava marina]|jgi:hypothetical protein|uniref:hypothetical protein n=1 Tax=Thioclava marina TaxID=1915077 RepID=UPI00199F7D00|nr:hypothetical protein [Thioclava marina]MBC7146999.1 hypothetical protein [Thioclava marina]
MAAAKKAGQVKGGAAAPRRGRPVTAQFFAAEGDRLGSHSCIWLDAGAAAGLGKVIWAECRGRRGIDDVTITGPLAAPACGPLS